MGQYKTMTLGFILAFVTFFGYTQLDAKQSPNNNDNLPNESRLDALAKFTKVLGTVEKYYVDDIEFNEIIDNAIEGLLSNLDAHSSFLDQKKFNDLKYQTEGEFGGLGITVGVRDGALTIIAPIEGTPADKAGLKAEDIILRINSQSTLNMTIDEAIKLMRGKPQTDIVLTIVRKGESKPFDVKITRDIIKIDSVYAKKIENENLLYLRVTNFDKKVVQSTKEVLSKHVGVQGVVLDLRNNPGGLLSQAVGLTDLFVNDGVIVSQKGRIKNENKEYKASKSNTIFTKPIVVLINAGSASASEIVAGALQDTKRAVLVGQKSFGKGSVQIILPVNNNEALRLTIARYYLPSGRTIQAVGITPDITAFPGDVPKDEHAFSIKENDLKKHLTIELNKIDKKNTKDETTDLKEKDIIDNEDIYKDNQLKNAIDILKALVLVKG